MLITPHIPLGISVAEGLEIMPSLGGEIHESFDTEHRFRLDLPEFSIAIYPEGDRIRSVWYNDPTGREDIRLMKTKVLAYLERYGALKNWEMSWENGWMEYWFNTADSAMMVMESIRMSYGLMNTVRRNER